MELRQICYDCEPKLQFVECYFKRYWRRTQYIRFTWCLRSLCIGTSDILHDACGYSFFIAREKALLDELIEKISKLDGICINGCHQAPHILSVSVPGIPTQNIINILQDAGICVSAGSACAKGHRSHTLTAMGLSPAIMDSSFRISLSRETTHEELNTLITVIENEILPRVK